MSIWSLTKAKISNSITILNRRIAGKLLTYDELQIVSDSINSAMVDICLDAGINRWRFLQSDCTATTADGTQYADLDADIFNIISGTVRIESENANLYPATLEFIYSSDPDRDDEGLPTWYALDSSSDPETIRIVFKPIPDNAYTVSFVAETIMDEDSVTSFPTYLHGMLEDKSKAVALRNLGFFKESLAFEDSYRKRRGDAKASQGLDAPLHINRRTLPAYTRRLESRISE